MKKTIYYDYNVFLRWKEGKNAELTHATSLLRTDDFIVLYSPAHVEEIACIARQDKNDDDTADQYVNQHLRALSCLSKNWEIVPDQSKKNGSAIIRELPSDCWKNIVVKGYELNYLLESLRLEKKKSLPPTIIGKRQIPEILSNPIAVELIEKHLGKMNLTMADVLIGKLHKNSDLCLKVVSAMYDVLAELGYKREPEKKNRPEMFDICHSIYSAQCDYFITEDKQFREKVREIYRFLNIPTKVMSIAEWIEYVFTFR